MAPGAFSHRRRPCWCWDCLWGREWRANDGSRALPSSLWHSAWDSTSGLTGWHYNQAKYFRSRALFGEWEDMGDPCVEDTEQTTFCTQTTAIFQVEGRRDCYIHMAERHNYMHSFLHCSYVWLPIHFGEDHTMSIAYQKEWKLSPNAY